MAIQERSLKYLEPKHSYFRWLLHQLWALVVFTFLTLMILSINVIQVFTLPLWLYSKDLMRRVNIAITYPWMFCIVNFMIYLNSIKIVVSGDSLPKRENAIMISNHQGMSDIPAIFCLAYFQGRLGDLKFFVKNSVKYCPGPGWGMNFLNHIFVKRNWTKDKSAIEQTFKSIIKYKIPVWVICFLEGTRITQSKLKKSQDFAKNRGLPIFNHVLSPKTTGFVTSVIHLRGSLDAVYDLTIGFPQGVPKMSHLFTRDCKEIHLHVKRFQISDIPNTEEDLRSWAWERFDEKDRLMRAFHCNGKFDKV